MIHIGLLNMIILCILVFVAGFVDAAAGGGGLITLPAYLFVGLPAKLAMGCNKCSAAFGTTLSAGRFLKNKVLDWKVALTSSVGSFIAAYISSSIAIMIDEKLLKTLLLAVLPIVAVILLIKRDFGGEDKSYLFTGKKKYITAFFIGFIIGLYDGLIGPGTGTFAIIAYCVIMKYDLRTASGNAKLLNLASNYASLIAFAINRKIIYSIALPAAVFGIVGNYFGAGFAIHKGAKFIRPMMIIVIIMLFGKVFYDNFAHLFM